MTRILVVEDEPSYLDPLLYQLTREGYEAHGAATGEEAWELYEEMEFDLVLLDLMRNKGRVLTRQQLIGRVWGSDYVGDTKTLDVHVKRIRAKIEADPSNPALLTTVRGLGYRICDERSR